MRKTREERKVFIKERLEALKKKQIMEAESAAQLSLMSHKLVNQVTTTTIVGPIARQDECKSLELAISDCSNTPVQTSEKHPTSQEKFK